MHFRNEMKKNKMQGVCAQTQNYDKSDAQAQVNFKAKSKLKAQLKGKLKLSLQTNFSIYLKSFSEMTWFNSQTEIALSKLFKI